MDERQSRSRWCARDVATAHTRLDNRPGDVATASVRGATRPGPTRRSREPPPSRSPSTTHAHFERARAAPSGEGVAPCTSARSRVLPPLHPNASEPKPRDPRAPPWEVTVPTDRYPHDPSLRHATMPTTGPSSPTPAIRCSHRKTATGSEDPTAAPCVATGDADHGIASHLRAYPRGVASGARPKPRPFPSTPRARAGDRPDIPVGAPRHVISSAHLSRSRRTNRADVAASSISSEESRFVAFSEPRTPAGSVPPRRSKPRPGGGPCEPKPAEPIGNEAAEKPGLRCPTSSTRCCHHAATRCR